MSGAEVEVSAVVALGLLEQHAGGELAALLSGHGVTLAELSALAWAEVGIGGGCSVLEVEHGGLLWMLTDGEGLGTPLSDAVTLGAHGADFEQLGHVLWEAGVEVERPAVSTKREAWAAFRETLAEVLPEGERLNRISKRIAWHEFLGRLEESGEITPEQTARWYVMPGDRRAAGAGA